MASESLCHEHFSNNSLQNGQVADERLQHRPRTSTGRLSPTHSAHGCLMRMSLQKMFLEKKAKKVRFFRNGDKFFKGLLYALSLERIRTFNALLEDLTRILVDQVNLPKGVRHIYTVDGKEKMTTLEQFKEGGSYVCSSVDSFTKLGYGRHENPQWSMLKKNEKNVWKSEWIEDVKDARDYIRPKLITIIKNGIKPRKAVRILLNKKTAHSFDQVLNDITNAIKLDAGAVRKIFSLGGKQVNSLADFFADEDIFIAYGPEKYSHDDFDLDSDECKYLTGASSVGKKGRRSVLSFTNYGQVSSSCLIDGSPFSSGRSSLTNSPRSTRKFQPKSCYSRQSSQNGHSTSVYFPKEILDHYLIGKLIGDGNFATVHECTDRTTEKEYAMKVIDKTKCKGKEHMIANEVAILRRVKHPNIVQLLEEFDMTNDLYMVMELVKGGDLFDAIQSATKYTERDASGMVYNLASALKYLHSLNIVHRDIKPENLLVVNHDDGSRSLKLGDFGLAVEIKDLLYTVCGTPTYVAPEILAETGYGLKVDIWAAGVITYILLCGFPPFVSQSNDQDELFDQIILGNYEFTSPYWDKISTAAKDLIRCMLEVDVEKRLFAAQVLESKWIAEDTAPENDMQVTISRKLSANFEHKSSLKPAGIALIAVSNSPCPA